MTGSPRSFPDPRSVWRRRRVRRGWRTLRRRLRVTLVVVAVVMVLVVLCLGGIVLGQRAS